jgi:hypothetical protein
MSVSLTRNKEGGLNENWKEGEGRREGGREGGRRVFLILFTLIQ